MRGRVHRFLLLGVTVLAAAAAGCSSSEGQDPLGSRAWPLGEDAGVAVASDAGVDADADAGVEVLGADAGEEEEGCSPECWACERCVNRVCVWDFEHCPCEERYGAGPEGPCSVGCPGDQLHLQLAGAGRVWLCGRFAASETLDLSGTTAASSYTVRGQVPQVPFHHLPLCQAADAGVECASGWVIR